VQGDTLENDGIDACSATPRARPLPLPRREKMRLLMKMSRRIKARQTEMHLHALPDHILKDIGLTRGGIIYAARMSRRLAED
jgi:uncharacterized protein YjiS (DUF1127 family)